LFDLDNFGGDRTFVSPETHQPVDLRHGACYPVSLTQILVAFGLVATNRQAETAEGARQFGAYADHEYGADSTKMPAYLAGHFHSLSARYIEATGRPSLAKWALITRAINNDWPIIAGIARVKRADGWVNLAHAFVIRGYRFERNDGDKITRTAIINDPAGSFTFTGKWDPAVRGEAVHYDYESFLDTHFVIVCRVTDRLKLDALAAEFSSL
jgi:hypothetical protein